MEEPRDETDSVDVEEAGKGKSLSSKTQTLDVDDANTVEVSDSIVSDVNGTDENLILGGGNTANSNSDEKVKADEDVVGGSLSGEESSEKTVSFHDVETTDDITDGASHEIGREEEETITSAGNDVTDEKENFEVEDNGAACDAVEQHVEIEMSHQSSDDVETLAVTEDQADQEKESAEKSEEENNKMETNKENFGTVSGVSSAAEVCRDEEIANVNEKEENGEAMEIDYAAGEQDVTVGGLLDNAGNESDGAIADTDKNESSVVKEMEIDEHKDNADTECDLTGTIETAEDAAPGEVEPLDHNGLFDPSSDITNFIDFSGVSSWSGNTQDLKNETRIVSLKEDTKATDMADEVAKVGIENESNEARVAFGAESPAATECSKEASDAILGSEKDQEGKDLEYLDKKTTDEQDAMREEDHITHEAASVDQNLKEDTEMEENPNNSDYDEEAGSDIKTKGVKRKADVLSEDSPGEGRKTVSFAKVSFTQRPSFKIGACIARAASQMAGSPSVLKGSNFGDENRSVESFVSQLHRAATDPDKENVVSDIAVGFFLGYRNSISQQVTPEKVSNKRVKLSNSNAGGTEAFEFEEMGDTYWTDRVIHNGCEEQTPPTAKEDDQVVPVELKPAQVQRTRRPYRRRQSQFRIPQSASVKPAAFDVNAPAELIVNFSETDTIPSEKSLSKMFRHFGRIQESKTEVDKEKNRARVVFKKGADAEAAYSSAGRFNIFGTKAVKYELSHTITETFKVQPYVVSLGQEDAAPLLPS